MSQLPYNPQPRSRLPWVIAGVALVIALVVAAAWWGSANAGTDDTAPPETTSPVAPSPSATPTETTVDGEYHVLDPQPTGCIAGNIPDADMLLEARERAPHTAYGAVEVAAATLKFSYRYPYPTKDELRAIEEMYVDDYDIVSAYDSRPTIAPDVAPPGMPLQATMVGGAWYLNSFGEEQGQADITIAFFWEIDGERDGSIARSENVVLVWTDDGWAITREGSTPMRPQEVLDKGVNFTGAC